MEVIRVMELTKDYGGMTAVAGISFKVTGGTVFGLLGPNGAGKTTTIECLVGLRNRSSGDVIVLGLDPERDRQKLFDKVGVQLQETMYQTNARVDELCRLFAAMYQKPLDYKLLLRRFDLEYKSRSFIGQLSGGQRQKLAIILALIANPAIIFLDELTTGLDPGSRRELWAYIQELKKEGRTIVMTTHSMEEATVLCDQICLINQGEIVAVGTVDEVVAQAEIDLVISFKTEQNVLPILQKLTLVRRVEQEGASVSVFAKSEQVLTDLILCLRDHDISYRKIRIIHPELEDAFLALVGSHTRGAAS